MSGTLSDFIKVAAAIALAAALVMLGFRIYNSNKEATNKSIEQTARLTAQIQDTEFLQYDGATVTGSEVLAVIERMESADAWIWCQGQSFVYDGGEAKEYGSDATGSLGDPVGVTQTRALIANAKDKANSTNYIASSALYKGCVVRDEGTDAIVGISFTPLYSTGGGP